MSNILGLTEAEGYHAENKSHTEELNGLGQGSGTFMAERAMKASYFKIYFHQSHIIGHSCHMGPQKRLILRYTDLVNALKGTSGSICCFTMF